MILFAWLSDTETFRYFSYQDHTEDRGWVVVVGVGGGGVTGTKVQSSSRLMEHFQHPMYYYME